jgi:hypothetical protein
MSSRRKRLFFLCVMSLAAARVSGAQTGARPDTAKSAQNGWFGTWSAASTTGQTLMGSWTAVPGQGGVSVTGTWTIFDAQRRTVAGGGWSAAKAPTQWSGAWRAVVTGKTGEYAGTWTADVDLKGDARLDDLFEKAIQAVVSGGWRYGKDSGAWSIRAARREGTSE